MKRKKKQEEIKWRQRNVNKMKKKRWKKNVMIGIKKEWIKSIKVGIKNDEEWYEIEGK